MSSLLRGIRVIESAALLNGDRLGCLLGDLGADVIKVESPWRGDYIRDFLGQITPHHSPAHLQVNKHKRSLALDLRREEGREVFWRLLDTADVFIDGNVASATERLGISYDEQRARRPEIVYCQCTGFGANGPYAALPSHGQMMSALAGALPGRAGIDGLVRPCVGEPMLGPDGSLYGVLGGGDPTAIAAIHAAYYVVAGLVQRWTTGEGCYIDVAATDSLISTNWFGFTLHANDERITDRSSLPVTAGGDGARYQLYETRDGRILLFCAIEHRFWENFCRAVGREDLIEHGDERAPVDFAGEAADLRHELQAIFHSRTLSEWMDLALERDVAMGPSLGTAEEIREDPHLQQRGLFVEGEHPQAGPFTYLREPGVVQGQPYEVPRAAPSLGEHSRELLVDLGYEPESAERLQAEGIVAAGEG